MSIPFTMVKPTEGGPLLMYNKCIRPVRHRSPPSSQHRCLFDLLLRTNLPFQY